MCPPLSFLDTPTESPANCPPSRVSATVVFVARYHVVNAPPARRGKTVGVVTGGSIDTAKLVEILRNSGADSHGSRTPIA